MFRMSECTEYLMSFPGGEQHVVDIWDQHAKTAWMLVVGGQDISGKSSVLDACSDIHRVVWVVEGSDPLLHCPHEQYQVSQGAEFITCVSPHTAAPLQLGIRTFLQKHLPFHLACRPKIEMVESLTDYMWPVWWSSIKGQLDAFIRDSVQGSTMAEWIRTKGQVLRVKDIYESMSPYPSQGWQRERARVYVATELNACKDRESLVQDVLDHLIHQCVKSYMSGSHPLRERAYLDQSYELEPCQSEDDFE